MARRAGIRDAGLLSLLRRNESECVRGDVVVFDGLLYAGHVAGDALTARAVCGVMRMFTDRAAQAGGILLVVAGEAEFVSTDGKIGDCFAVDLVAIEAAHLAVIHETLHKIIALHAVFMPREIGKLKEIVGSGFQFFEVPIIGQAFAGREAYGPVVVASVDGI